MDRHHLTGLTGASHDGEQRISRPPSSDEPIGLRLGTPAVLQSMAWRNRHKALWDATRIPRWRGRPRQRIASDSNLTRRNTLKLPSRLIVPNTAGWVGPTQFAVEPTITPTPQILTLLRAEKLWQNKRRGVTFTQTGSIGGHATDRCPACPQSPQQRRYCWHGNASVETLQPQPR